MKSGIYGIGTDIVRIDRMRNNLDRYGDKFARRILTESEFQEYSQSGQPAHFLARRFAAKEAAVKAMGLGFSEGLAPHSIGIIHDAKGKPILQYFGKAEELRTRLGIGEGYISIADEQDHAVAFVTLLAGNS